VPAGHGQADGQMIVLPVQLRRERTAEQVVLNRQANALPADSLRSPYEEDRGWRTRSTSFPGWRA
jgi:hypothetical protein